MNHITLPTFLTKIQKMRLLFRMRRPGSLVTFPSVSHDQGNMENSVQGSLYILVLYYTYSTCCTVICRSDSDTALNLLPCVWNFRGNMTPTLTPLHSSIHSTWGISTSLLLTLLNSHDHYLSLHTIQGFQPSCSRSNHSHSFPVSF